MPISEDEKPFAEKPLAEKPFTEYATKGERGADGANRGWIAAGVMAALLIAALLLWASALGKLGGMDALRTKLDQTKTSLTSAQAEIYQVYHCSQPARPLRSKALPRMFRTT